MNTSYTFNHSTRIQSINLTTSPIIIIKRPKQKHQLLPCKNTTNLRTSATPNGVVNLVVQLNTELLSNCLNSALSLRVSHLPLWWPYCMETNPSKPKALSFCEAEIMSTNESATELQSLKHCANDIGIPEAYSRTKIYNNKKSAVQWEVQVTSKGTKHINLR